MSLELTASELQLVRQILATWVPDRVVWVFGSRATGNAKKYSDLDLAILGETPLSLAQLADLAEAFSLSDLPFRVDLVDWSQANEAIKANIHRQHQVIWPLEPLTPAE